MNILVLKLFIIEILISFLMITNLPASTSNWPQQQLTQGAKNTAFVDEKTCSSCHLQESKAWQGSNHQQAMQEANEQTVLGDFNNTEITVFSVTTKFFKRNNKFFIHTQAEDGKYHDFQVEYTFGVEPLQQYLLRFPKGRLQAFDIAWDTLNKRWFHLKPEMEILPNDSLHWTKRFYTWNSACAECHSTDFKLKYDLKTQSYQSSWAMINVGCQACHGPAEKHLLWATKTKNKLPNTNKNYPNKGLVVDYANLNSKQSIETCARCHSRRQPISSKDQHGQAFLNDFIPSLLEESLYHADGQILDEVYVYGSFTQSKMYQKNVTCMDCHQPHQLKLRYQGNSLCTQCHQQKPPLERFKTLQAKNYDDPTHHFHSKDSTGAQCVNCHMPATTYMGVDPRRDHSFSIPRPDLSVKLKTPNACLRCHDKKTNEWAVEQIIQHKGKDWQRDNDGEIFYLGRLLDPKAANALLALAKNTKKPAIVRATAINQLALYGERYLPALYALINDKDGLVRTITVRALNSRPIAEKKQRLLPLLNDPLKAVRIETAASLAEIEVKQLKPIYKLAFQSALADYKAAQTSQTDWPEGYFNLGRLYEKTNEITLAVQSYKTALKLDKNFIPAYHHLANLHYRNRDYSKSEQVFRSAIKNLPKQGAFYYSLSLLLVELKRSQEALSLLETAVELMPKSVSVHYNYGLLLQQSKQMQKAEYALRQAQQLAPNNTKILKALVIFYIQQKQSQPANSYLQQWLKVAPADKRAYRLLKVLTNMKKVQNNN